MVIRPEKMVSGKGDASFFFDARGFLVFFGVGGGVAGTSPSRSVSVEVLRLFPPLFLTGEPRIGAGGRMPQSISSIISLASLRNLRN